MTVEPMMMIIGTYFSLVTSFIYLHLWYNLCHYDVQQFRSRLSWELNVNAWAKTAGAAGIIARLTDYMELPGRRM